jgi:hypothetical protein
MTLDSIAKSFNSPFCVTLLGGALAAVITSICEATDAGDGSGHQRPGRLNEQGVHPPACSNQNRVLCETCRPDPKTSDPGFLAESSTG